MVQDLAILATFVFLYSIIGGRLERTPVNGALVFAGFGVICSPLGLGILHLDVDAEGLRTLAELTLALVLFTDAANADLRVLRHSLAIPRRLLLVGLPLTVGLGYGAGILLFDGLHPLEVALLATMLAPTDAALGKAVVTNPAVPDRIRQGLNVESGLNDGICVPVLFLFLEMATASDAAQNTGTLALELLAKQIGIGLAVGIGLTATGTALLRFATARGWVTETWCQLPVVSLAMACYALAQTLEGSGFIAAFAGGLLFGALAKDHKHGLLLAAEGTGDTLALLTWVAFGAAVVGQSGTPLTWNILLYAVLSLTLIRMLPVFLVLAGTGMRPEEKLFVGWFGPRGLASIVFGVIVLNAQLPGGDTLSLTVVCTIVLSIVAHGLSATPWVGSMARRSGHPGGAPNSPAPSP